MSLESQPEKINSSFQTNSPPKILQVVLSNGNKRFYLWENPENFNPIGYRVLVPLLNNKGATGIVIDCWEIEKFLKIHGDFKLENLPFIDSFPDRYPAINVDFIPILQNVVRRYLTSLGQAIFSLLPKELDWYQDYFVILKKANDFGLPKDLKKILEYIAKRRGSIEYEKLLRHFDSKLIHLLIKLNFLEIVKKWVAPKYTQEFFRLAVPRVKAEKVISRLRKREKKEKASLLIELLETYGELSREEIKEEGISSEIIYHLLKKGVIEKVVYNLPPIRANVKLSNIWERELKSYILTDKETFLVNYPLSKRKEFLKGLVYEYMVKRKKNVLIVVPDKNSLRLYSQFLGEIFGDKIVPFANFLSSSEKIKNWFLAYSMDYKTFICTPQWILAPFNTPPAVIYIENENSTAYKMSHYPYLNIKNLLLQYAKNKSVNLVFSSYPPSLEIYLRVSKRFKPAEKKSIKEPFLAGFSLSKEVYIHKNPLKDEKFFNFLNIRAQYGEILILLPKKGFANLKCQACGEVLECSRCWSFLYLEKDDTSLTAVCPICGKKEKTEEVFLCPRCGEEMKPFNIGIGLLKDVLKERLPKEVFSQIKFSTAPSIDLEESFNTTLILYADKLLSLGDFRRNEAFFDYIVKASLTLKQEETSQLILHFPYEIKENPALNGFLSDNFSEFYEKEIEFRKLLNLPPFVWLYLIVVSFREKNDSLAQEIYEDFKKALQQFSPNLMDNVEFSRAPIFKERDLYHYWIVVKIPVNLLKQPSFSRFFPFFRNLIQEMKKKFLLKSLSEKYSSKAKGFIKVIPGF